MAKQKVDANIIINQSIKLFRQKTYHNISMADIAESCGLLKGSLYHHFNSKEALMIKVIETIHTFFNQEVFSIAYLEDLSSSEKMNRIFKATEKVFVNKNTGKMYGNMGVESAMVVEEFTPLLQAFFNDFFKAFKKLYSEKYDEKVAEELAERSVAEIEGSIMISRIYDDTTYIYNTFKRLKQRLDNNKI